jgi:glycosyltransferase involved in cell wall biosynthesis
VARLLYPRATAVTGVSAAVVTDLVQEIGVDPQRVPLHVVPNAVDAQEVIALSLLNQEVVTGPGPVFVNVARHARQKNLPLLLRAFRAYLTDGGSGTLALIGAGPETQCLCRLACDLDIAGSVRFLGGMANPFPQVAAATAFVLSSEEEGFGLVLVEAMALGVPVVATDCPGAPRDILLGGRAGLLVPSQDEKALAAALHRIASDPALQAQLSTAGRQRAADFSPAAVGREWMSLLLGAGCTASHKT